MSQKPVSEDLLTSIMVNVPKHFSNLKHRTFIIFNDHCRVNRVGKCLSYWHEKSWDCWAADKNAANKMYPALNRDNLTIRIQMQLCQKQKTFPHFLLHFWNLSLILNSLKKKMSLIAFAFPKLWTPKTYSYKCLKSPVSEDPSTSSMVNVPNHFKNLRHNIFIIFIDHCQVNWVGKTHSYWQEKSWDCLRTDSLAMESILFLIEKM